MNFLLFILLCVSEALPIIVPDVNFVNSMFPEAELVFLRQGMQSGLESTPAISAHPFCKILHRRNR